MATLIYALNQTLDGYIDHTHAEPDPVLFDHFIEDVRGLAGSIYGRVMYETMRYWDEDRPEWSATEREYAAVWRRQPKWVVSTTMDAVGPNATLLGPDLEAEVRRIQAEVEGYVEVAGPTLAQSLTDLGLIDVYRIYLHPVVGGHGKTYFAGTPPKLHLDAAERIGPEVIRLTYVPV